MTVAFMAFAAIIIGEYISETAGRRALWPFVLIGIVSVFYWTVTESLGRGDLRPYGLVQFLPMLVIPSIMLMFRSTFTGSLYIWACWPPIWPPNWPNTSTNTSFECLLRSAAIA